MGLVAHAMDDDGVLLWLNDNSTTGTTFAKTFLTAYSSGATINIGGTTGNLTIPVGIGSDASGNPVSKNFTSAGLSQIYAGSDARNFIHVNAKDMRVPDVIGIAQLVAQGFILHSAAQRGRKGLHGGPRGRRRSGD